MPVAGEFFELLIPCSFTGESPNLSVFTASPGGQSHAEACLVGGRGVCLGGCGRPDALDGGVANRSSQGHAERSVTMCTMITTEAKVAGCGQGVSSWCALRDVAVSYDHPLQLALERGLNVDFVNMAA